MQKVSCRTASARSCTCSRSTNLKQWGRNISGIVYTLTIKTMYVPTYSKKLSSFNRKNKTQKASCPISVTTHKFSFKTTPKAQTYQNINSQNTPITMKFSKCCSNCWIQQYSILFKDESSTRLQSVYEMT